MIFTQDDLPFLSEGSGKITIDVSSLGRCSSVDPTAYITFTTKFGESDASDLLLGPTISPTLRIKAGTFANVIAIDRGSDGISQQLLNKYHLSDYLVENPDDILLLLELSPKSEDSVTACARTNSRSSEITFKPEGNVSYSYLRSFPKAAPIEKILIAYLSGVRLPAHLTAALRCGEIILYQYWGELKIGVQPQSLGFRGAVTSVVLGGFSLEVREHHKPGWARVLVRKKLAPYQQCASQLQNDTLAIHWEQVAYYQVEENEVLIDLSLNLTTEAGKSLMRAVGQGDFSEVMTAERNHVVTIEHFIFAMPQSLSMCA